MTEISKELVSRLVVGRKQDGRGVYDPDVKARIVQECRKPGVSVARVAMQCGVNANLLRRWIGEHVPVGTNSGEVVAPALRADGAAFVALQIEAAKPHPGPANPPAHLELRARLPNEVQLDFSLRGLDQLQPLIEVLGGLKCSSSTNP